MAKARQALSLWRGRAGGIVYSALNGKQVIKSAPASVSNPKTDAQTMQRMKLAPAANFYRALEGIVPLGFVSHTFQGRKYGNANRLRFMQLAMLNNQGPYVPKDTLQLIPFDYQISEGSLPSVTARVHVADNNTMPATATLITQNISLTADNVQAWANFLGVQVGDQISFLGFFTVGNGQYSAEACRIKIEAGASLNLADYDIAIYAPRAGEVSAQTYGSALFFFDEVAGAVVVSREQANGEFLRSTEYVVISDDIREQFYTPAAMDAAIASYADNIGQSASPYYNNLGNSAFDGTIYVSTFKLRNGDSTVNAPIFWGKTANGNKVIFVNNNVAANSLVFLDNEGTGYVPIRNSRGDYYTVADILSSVSWAGQVEWEGMAAYEQWNSGQRAKRPYSSSVTEETEVNPT